MIGSSKQYSWAEIALGVVFVLGLLVTKSLIMSIIGLATLGLIGIIALQDSRAKAAKNVQKK